MEKIINDNNILFEAIINIFTVEKGTLKILLERKKEDPYKGYWQLPNELLNKNETLDQKITEILKQKIGIDSIYKEQSYTFSDIKRNPNERVIATSYIGIIDSKTIELKKEDLKNNDTEWFSISEIPKMAFDHKIIIENAIEKLRTRLVNSNVLKNLFPSDFTLPELQNVYENILNKKLDRRNFRKKFIALNIIEDTGYKNEGASGRPAKLYKFKENINEINLFW